ncbi:MAG: suppressor of loss of ypt1 [Thelocarpon superellum]|nr:MAG: suppressor of loss of ypt1 [Thelocarpon superellum]
MPHSTSSPNDRRSPSAGFLPTAKFPTAVAASAVPDHVMLRQDESVTLTPLAATTSRQPSPHANGSIASDRWHSPRDSAGPRGITRHGRQKSLSDAIHNIRTRRGSVSANAQELADALKAPVSPKLVVLCIIWYFNSALTNTSSKSILIAFPKPVTLTLVQFGFVAFWCVFFAHLARRYPSLRETIPALQHSIRSPSRDVVMTTLPLAAFQVGGHLLNSTATSTMPVSLVHTVKGLSPLITVLAYRFIFRVHHAPATYLSLIPLTVGVMLACSTEFSGHFFGLLCSLGGAIIFVWQNIFSKQLFNEAVRAEADGQAHKSRKLDKLNLLCYSSGLAFILTTPLWLWSEGFALMGDFFHDGALDLSGRKDALSARRLTLEFLFNGSFHFGQNIMAFILLSMVSPVTYSVASLVKRIFIIVASIVWFGNSTTPMQAFGIALTFLGLYLYDRTSDASRADRRVKLDQLKAVEPLLPFADHRPHVSSTSADFAESPISMAPGAGSLGLLSSGNSIQSPTSAVAVNGYSHVHPHPLVHGDEKKSDDAGAGGGITGRSRGQSTTTAWLPPGTRQEDTWQARDRNFAGGATTGGAGVSVTTATTGTLTAAPPTTNGMEAT